MNAMFSVSDDCAPATRARNVVAGRPSVSDTNSRLVSSFILTMMAPLPDVWHDDARLLTHRQSADKSQANHVPEPPSGPLAARPSRTISILYVIATASSLARDLEDWRPPARAVKTDASGARRQRPAIFPPGVLSAPRPRSETA